MSESLSDRKGQLCQTILIVPNDGLDNFTSLQVLADRLQERGNRVIFSIDLVTKGLLAFNGLKYDMKGLSKLNEEFNNDNNSDVNCDVFKSSSIKVYEKFCLKKLWKKFLETKNREMYYKKLIEHMKPDIIIVESIICSPALTTSGIPWVWLNFGAPNLCLDDERLPPAWSGLSKDSEIETQFEFREKRNELLANLRNEVNDWCALKDVTSIPTHTLHPHSPFLNLYVYPKDLDYDLGKPFPPFPPKDWFRISSLLKASEESIQLPEEVTESPGKVVFLSLSPYGSADINLMKRLIKILSQSPNKFILTKDIDIELSDNFWTINGLSHSDAIRASDLVITNGDNNTITEALFWGKPLVVMPLFGDQLDNAQRVKDNALGVILEPHSCGLATTLGSITNLLEDPLVYRRLTNISHKMQTSGESEILCQLIEQINEK